MSSIIKGLNEALKDPESDRLIKNIISQNPKGSMAEKLVLNHFLATPMVKDFDMDSQEWIETAVEWLQATKQSLQKKYPELDLSDLQSLAEKMYEDYLASLGKLNEGIKSKLAGAALATAMGLSGVSPSYGADLSAFSSDYLEQVVSGQHPRPMVSVADAKAELQAREAGKQQSVTTKPLSNSTGFSKSYLQSVVNGTHPRPMISKEKALELLNKMNETSSTGMGGGSAGIGGGAGLGIDKSPMEKVLERPLGEDNSKQLSVEELATISDEALDKAYGYGRSSPGNTFGWQANLMSAAYAKKMIDSGVTDIEKISDAIHKGWNVTAQKFVQDPNQFSDTEKLRQAGKLEAKLQQRAKLMKINYSQLDNDEQEKDRVVARALLQAIKGEIAETLQSTQGGMGQSYRKYKPKPAGVAEEQAPMFTPEEKMVNANDPMSDGWRWYSVKEGMTAAEVKKELDQAYKTIFDNLKYVWQKKPHLEPKNDEGFLDQAILYGTRYLGFDNKASESFATALIPYWHDYHWSKNKTEFSTKESAIIKGLQTEANKSAFDQKSLDKLIKDIWGTETKSNVTKPRYLVYSQNTGLELETNSLEDATYSAKLMAKRDLDSPALVYDRKTKFPIAAYRGSEDLLLQKNRLHDSVDQKSKAVAIIRKEILNRKNKT